MTDQLEILMRQYELLIQYTSKTIPSSKNNILSFGLSVLAAILTGNLYLLGTGKCPDIPVFSFMILIPVAAGTLLFIWLGEVDRMMRAGIFILELERRLNAVAGARLLFWEGYIRDPHKRVRYPDLCAMGVFLGSILLSPLAPLLFPGTVERGLTPGMVLTWAGVLEAVAVALALRVGVKINRGLAPTRFSPPECG